MSLDRIRDLHERALSPRWSVRRRPGGDLIGADTVAGDAPMMCRMTPDSCRADAELIVALRNNAEALLDLADAARDVVHMADVAGYIGGSVASVDDLRDALARLDGEDRT